MEHLTGMETVRIKISFRVGGLAVAFAMNYVKLVEVDAQIQHVDRFAELDFVPRQMPIQSSINRTQKSTALLTLSFGVILMKRIQ